MRATELTDAEYKLFRGLVDGKAGIDLPPARRSHLENAVSRALVRGGFDDPSTLYRHLLSVGRSTDLEDFIASLTVGETHFFRNRPQFEALERQVLPDLIKRRAEERRLRIWSAGCSSGEEPYSLAILLDRILPAINTWNILILGTDIDRRALKKAREGIYRPWSFREVPPEIQSRYFTQVGEDLELIPRIREMVTFEYLNLVDDSYPSLVSNTNGMDLVVCRNVLIYFRESTARLVIARLHRAMADEAWFLAGHAEPSQWLSELFSVQNFPGAIGYLKSKERAPTVNAVRRAAKSDPASRKVRRRPKPSGVTRRSRTEIPRVDLDPTPSPEDPGKQTVTIEDPSDVEEHLTELKGLAAAHPADPRPPYLIAKIHAGRLELEAAAKWSHTALERERLFAPAHYLQGMVAVEDGRPEDAVAAFRRCVYADPLWVLGHFVLAETLLRLGERRRASGALRNVERLLNGVPPDQEVAEGDGLTVGRLRDLTAMQKEIFGLEESERPS